MKVYTNTTKIDLGIALFGFDWIKDETITAALDCLEDRERLVIKKRFLVHLNLEQIGDDLGVTRERVRQIESKALRKMRKFLKDKADIFEISYQKQNQNRRWRG